MSSYMDELPFRNMPESKKITDYDLTLVVVGVILFAIGILTGAMIF